MLESPLGLGGHIWLSWFIQGGMFDFQEFYNGFSHSVWRGDERERANFQLNTVVD
jgi:hypothetical protein